MTFRLGSPLAYLRNDSVVAAPLSAALFQYRVRWSAVVKHGVKLPWKLRIHLAVVNELR